MLHYMNCIVGMDSERKRLFFCYKWVWFVDVRLYQVWFILEVSGAPDWFGDVFGFRGHVCILPGHKKKCLCFVRQRMKKKIHVMKSIFVRIYQKSILDDGSLVRKSWDILTVSIMQNGVMIWDWKWPFSMNESNLLTSGFIKVWFKP